MGASTLAVRELELDTLLALADGALAEGGLSASSEGARYLLCELAGAARLGGVAQYITPERVRRLAGMLQRCVDLLHSSSSGSSSDEERSAADVEECARCLLRVVQAVLARVREHSDDAQRRALIQALVPKPDGAASAASAASTESGATTAEAAGAAFEAYEAMLRECCGALDIAGGLAQVLVLLCA